MRSANQFSTRSASCLSQTLERKSGPGSGSPSRRAVCRSTRFRRISLTRSVNAIVDGVLVAIDDEFESAGLPTYEAANEAAPVAEGEKVLWEGRPFLSLTTHYKITNERVRAAVRAAGPRFRRHRAHPHPGPGPYPGHRGAHAGHRRHPHPERRSLEAEADAGECARSPTRSTRSCGGRCWKPGSGSATASRKRCSPPLRRRQSNSPGSLRASRAVHFRLPYDARTFWVFPHKGIR